MASIQARKKEAKRLPPVKPTFREIAKDWYDIKVIAEGLGESVQESTTRRMKVLNATLGDMEAIKIEPPDVLRAISAIQKRGKHTEANLTRGVASRIFLYGIPHGYCVRNPAADLSGAMTSPISKPRPALTEPVTFGALLRDIQKYRGWHGNIVGLALQLLPLVATRPYKEFCLGEWTEIKFDKALWIIPQERMKERDGDHYVPLSRQAILTGMLITVLPMLGDYYTNQLLSGAPNTSMIGNVIQGQLSTPSAGQGAILSLIVLVVLLVPMIYYVVQTNRASRVAS